MAISLRDDLPDVLREARTRLLFVTRLDVHPLHIIGATPAAYRRVGVVPGGVFEGEQLSGLVLDATGRMSAATAAPHSTCAWCSRQPTRR